MSIAAKVPGWKWGVVWAMFFATMLNYMDRQTMASTSEFIVKEFKLSEEGYGNIEFWFGISFAVMQLFAGVMADRLNLRWLYAGAVLVWSAAGFMTGLADTILMLYMCRVVLGIGESFNWVCAGGVVQRLIPRESRSLANGIFHGGASVGAAVTPLLAANMVGADGKNWRELFLICGGAGLLWVVMWFTLLRGSRAAEVSHSNSHAREAGAPAMVAETPFIEVMKLRTFWITLGFGIGVNVTWHVFRIWLPRLFNKEWHVTHEQLQYMLVGYYVAADLGSLAAGWATRRLVQAASMRVEQARLYMMFATSILCLVAIPAVLLSNHTVGIVLLFVFAAGSMGGFAAYFAMSQEISGPHTSRCLGVIGAIIWAILAGVHPLIGRIADQLGTFLPILIVVACIPLIGTFTGLFWPKTPSENTAAL